MTDANFAILIDFAAGGLMLTAVLIVWRRDLRAIVRLLAWQGVALAAIPLAARGPRRRVALIASASRYWRCARWSCRGCWPARVAAEPRDAARGHPAGQHRHLAADHRAC